MIDSKAQTNGDDIQSSLERRFRQEHDAAFDEIIEHYSPVVRRLVHRLLAWDQETDDVVQDVFVAVFVHRRRFRAQASLKTWIYSIAVNICRTRNRRRLIWQTFIANTNHDTRDVQFENPLSASLNQEQADKVRQAARRLPMKYRDVVVLKYLEELPTGQILDILKIDEKAFYTRLNRARNHMQTLLADYLDEKK
jgi:RNA polymerase sigma factor (sigma-70 family)